MFEKFSNKARAAADIAVSVSVTLGQGYVGTEHILLGIIQEGTSGASRILNSHGVTRERVADLIRRLIAPSENVHIAERGSYSPRAVRLIEAADKEAMQFKSQLILPEHLLIAIIKDSECAASRILTSMAVNIQKLYMDILVTMGEDANKYRDDVDIAKAREKGKSNTPTLDTYSRDLTDMAREGKLDPVIGREDEIERVIQILSRRTKNNPCLIGEPGVGKTAIAEGLALKIVEGNVPDTVKDKRVVTLDLSGMVAGSKYRGEFEERIKSVINEVKRSRDVLLFIDELHTIIGAGGAEGAMDASNILKPSLARGEIQVIGATTIDEYRKHIEKDAALERRFQPVVVEEPTQEQAIEILKGLRESYEKHHKVTITDEALVAAVKLSARYINDRFLPDKAIDLIDEASSKARLTTYVEPEEIGKLADRIKELEDKKIAAIKNEEKLREEKENLLKAWEKEKNETKISVNESNIADIVASWTKIPVRKLEEGEAERLRKLESVLHERVIGQEEAVTAVSKAVRRGRVGLKDPKRPISSFLFLGPTGVGKTELSKALSEAMFGTENSLIRVDMSEYMEKHSVSKIVGSPPGYVGYEEGGQLSEKVRRNPYSVILFDEIEKAHPDVFNILLQVLDDGHITDAQGRMIDFKNTVIIMTSNAGASKIIEPKKLGFISDNSPESDHKLMKDNVMAEIKKIFKPEFLNRIDDIIVFHSLEKKEMIQIVEIMLKSLSKRTREQMNITLDVDEEVKNYIVDKGYDPKYGARPLKRTIQTEIEDRLAEEILDNRIFDGDEVHFTLENGDIKISSTHTIKL